VGSKFLVYDYEPTQYVIFPEFRVTSLADGGFVLIWQHSHNNSTTAMEIYGQRYDAQNNRVGPEFQVNTYTIGEQLLASVQSLEDRGFIVTWTSDGQDGSGKGIYSQRYDLNANPIGSEFRVNTNTNNSQIYPAIAPLKDGKFIAVWETANNQYYRLGVSGQIFGQVPEYGVFNLEQLTRSGFVDGLSYTPVEVGGLPLASLYDESFYLSQYPDVAAAVSSGILNNGYTHFVDFGQFEGRNPSILYDEDFYLQQNPDVANAVMTGVFESGFQHYTLSGQLDGRSPSTVFNEIAYRNNNPDVADAITNGSLRSGFEHYLELGQAEGRYPLNFLYDENDYLSQNPDVADAVLMGVFEDGFEHYINYGQTEQRNPSRLFNESQYLALNTDVADAVSSGLFSSGFEHYILSGRAEGRGI
jgi:hypothetical protein